MFVSDLHFNSRYFEGGVSSVFLWDLEDGGFAGVVLLKKCKALCVKSHPRISSLPAALTSSSPSEPSGAWDSIHVFEVAERGRQAHYKLTSTVMLSMIDRGVGQSSKEDKVEAKRDGEVTLSGSMTRQVCPRIYHVLMSLLIFCANRRSKTIRCKIRTRTLRTLGG